MDKGIFSLHKCFSDRMKCSYCKDILKNFSKRIVAPVDNIHKGWCDEFKTRLDIIICHSSTSLRVTKMLFCQNGVLLGRSFWPKDSLVTLLLFELWLLWCLAQSQIHRIFILTRFERSAAEWVNDWMIWWKLNYSFMYLKIFSPYF